MKLNKRYIGLFLFLAAALIAMYGAYGFITNRQSSEGPSIGVVQIDDVLEFNPSYEDYKNAKAELEQLKAQYAIEQEALNTKSDLQNEQLKSLSLDPTLSDALNIELQTRIATKQNQLNAQLDAKRAELVQKYMKELKVANKGYDLEIVIYNYNYMLLIAVFISMMRRKKRLRHKKLNWKTDFKACWLNVNHPILIWILYGLK